MGHTKSTEMSGGSSVPRWRRALPFPYRTEIASSFLLPIRTVHETTPHPPPKWRLLDGGMMVVVEDEVRGRLGRRLVPNTNPKYSVPQTRHDTDYGPSRQLQLQLHCTSYIPCKDGKPPDATYIHAYTHTRCDCWAGNDMRELLLAWGAHGIPTPQC